LELYVEQELSPQQQEAVEAHLAVCEACRRRLANLEQITRLLYALPPAQPAPDLARRVVAAVEAQAARAPVRRPWRRLVPVGIGTLFSVWMLLALGYQTLLAWRQSGAGQFISLLFRDPGLALRYPAEVVYAILESLPILELGLTLGLALVMVLLLEQFVTTLTGPVQAQFNGNHSGRGMA